MAEYLCEEDMNTGEYISRDMALRQLNATCLATDCDNYNGVRCRACAYADAMDFIDAIPAADVQSVVRCKDCKHRKEHHYEEIGEKPYIKYECKFTKYSMSPNGFCSFGVRIDGNTGGKVNEN